MPQVVKSENIANISKPRRSEVLLIPGYSSYQKVRGVDRENGELQKFRLVQEVAIVTNDKGKIRRVYIPKRYAYIYNLGYAIFERAEAMGMSEKEVFAAYNHLANKKHSNNIGEILKELGLKEGQEKRVKYCNSTYE